MAIEFNMKDGKSIIIPENEQSIDFILKVIAQEKSDFVKIGEHSAINKNEIVSIINLNHTQN